MPLNEYIFPFREKPDLFEPVPNRVIAFPCHACVHLERPEAECERCCHYQE